MPFLTSKNKDIADAVLPIMPVAIGPAARLAGASARNAEVASAEAAAVAAGYDFKPGGCLFFGAAVNGYYIGDRVNFAASVRVGLSF